jgi:hypothetical protein
MRVGDIRWIYSSAPSFNCKFKSYIYILRFIITSQSSYAGPVTGFVSQYLSTASRTSRTSSPIPSKSLDNSSISVLSIRQAEIMSALDMDQGLVGNKGSRASIQIIWKRYVTIMKAISGVCDVDWGLGKKPSDGEIIGVYWGKSTFYEQVKVLKHVKCHSEMVDWLEGTDLDDDVDQTVDLWEFSKAMYTLKDLEKWMDKKQREGQSDRKGKKAAVPKGKRNNDGDGSTSSVPLKRAHKKSAGGRKQ